MIQTERIRQVNQEGWTTEHDDQHKNDQLAVAAAIYALPEVFRNELLSRSIHYWPWDKKWWKPTPQDRIKELTKAGALIAAEIDRLNRFGDKYGL